MKLTKTEYLNLRTHMHIIDGYEAFLEENGARYIMLQEHELLNHFENIQPLMDGVITKKEYLIEHMSISSHDYKRINKIIELYYYLECDKWLNQNEDTQLLYFMKKHKDMVTYES